MRKCKVRGCDRKHHAKGYCGLHYERKFVWKIPFTRRCKRCNKILPPKHRKYCSRKCESKFNYKKHREYQLKHHRENYVYVPALGAKGKIVSHVFTDGVTEEMKPLVSKIKEKVLNECIKNPRKFLGEYKRGKNV